MKKIFVLVVIIFILTVIGGAIIILFHSNKHHSIKEFDVLEYQWEIENFSFEKNVGQIDDADTAIEKAKDLWSENYSTVNNQPYDPIKKRKIEVFFDQHNDCWLVKTTLPSNTKGAVPHTIIEKDGTVLAVWMG